MQLAKGYAVMETLYDHAGGQVGLRKFVEIFYGKVLADPLLHPLFGDGKPEHVAHLTAFTAECFVGPTHSVARWEALPG